jgi:hypothetical protein
MAGFQMSTEGMWLAAQASGGLTKAGERLGVELLDVIRANTLLGYNVPGITAPDYGNLTLTGIAEHTQLARRLAARTAPLLSSAVTTAPATNRQVLVSTSGVNRAIDSANFFVTSLTTAVPGLSARVANTAPLTPYPVNQPVAQAPGINRFQLYFHKLNAKTDLPSAMDPYNPVYQSSLNYQNYLASDPVMLKKVNDILYDVASYNAARAVLKKVFTPAFIDALDSGRVSYSNTGTFNFTSDDGKFTAKTVGDGTTTIGNSVDAANSLYAVYSILPAMTHEVQVNVDKYFPANSWRYLAI